MSGILFIPQLFYREIFLPFGVQSTQIHLNNWDDTYYKNFEKFINKQKKNISDFNYIIGLNNENNLKKIINFSVEKTLKVIRFFR